MPTDFDWKAFLTPHTLAAILNNRMTHQQISTLMVERCDVHREQALKLLQYGPAEVSETKKSEEYKPKSVSTQQWRTAEDAIRQVRRTLGDDTFGLLQPQGLATAAMRLFSKQVPRNPYVYEQMLKVMRW